MTEKSIDVFLSELSSGAPVPGGGGASALAGAAASALASMVANLTTGKKKYAEYQGEIDEILVKTAALVKDFEKLIEKDAEVFEPLSKAYSIPKDEPGRDETLEKCLKDAAAAPLKIFDLTCEALEIVEEFGEKGSRLLISDAATGAAHLRAALQGAAVNVKVNTKLMKDREYAEKIDMHIDEYLKKYTALADKIFDSIYKTF